MKSLKTFAMLGALVFSVSVCAETDCQQLKDKVAIDAEMMNGTSQQLSAIARVLEGSEKALARVKAEKDMFEDYHIHYHQELNKKLSDLVKFIEDHKLHATAEHAKLEKKVKMNCH